jgi:ankyrin repeat protein
MMGLMIIQAVLAIAICGCSIPLVVVLCSSRARRRPLAWLLASVPMLLLGLFVVKVVREHQRETQMIDAAGRGDILTVQRLLESGVSPDAVDLDGIEAIHSAISGGHWKIVRLLVAKGAHDADSGDDGHLSDLASTRLDEAGLKDLAAKVRARGLAP